MQASSLPSFHIWLRIKTRFVAGLPPSVTNLCRGPSVTNPCGPLCRVLWSARGLSRGVCRRTPLSVTNLFREMAAQACYKANVFDSLPYCEASEGLSGPDSLLRSTSTWVKSLLDQAQAARASVGESMPELAHLGAHCWKCRS